MSSGIDSGLSWICQSRSVFPLRPGGKLPQHGQRRSLIVMAAILPEGKCEHKNNICEILKTVLTIKLESLNLLAYEKEIDSRATNRAG